MAGYIPADDDVRHDGGFPPVLPDDTANHEKPDNSQPAVAGDEGVDPEFQSRTTEVNVATEGEEELQFEVVDDLAPADQGKPVDINPKAPTYEEAEALPGLPEVVKKRFAALSATGHIHRRQAELARAEAEAYRVANEVLLKKLEDKNKQAYDASKMGIDFARQNATSQVEQAKKRVADMYVRLHNGENVANEIADAQAALAEAQANAQMIASIPVADTPPPAIDPEAQAAMSRAEQLRQQAPAEMDPSLQAWTARNPWFANNKLQGEDGAIAMMMSQFAVQVAQELNSRGIEDYNVLDAELKRRYPELYSRLMPGTGARQPAQQKPSRAPSVPPVAAPTRTKQPSGNRTYQLTKKQLAICENLGIKPQEYLRQLVQRGEA